MVGGRKAPGQHFGGLGPTGGYRVSSRLLIVWHKHPLHKRPDVTCLTVAVHVARASCGTSLVFKAACMP